MKGFLFSVRRPPGESAELGRSRSQNWNGTCEHEQGDKKRNTGGDEETVSEDVKSLECSCARSDGFIILLGIRCRA